jgi:hypothetical protein
MRHSFNLNLRLNCSVNDKADNAQCAYPDLSANGEKYDIAVNGALDTEHQHL